MSTPPLTIVTVAPGCHQSLLERKKSKFLAHAQCIHSWEEAKSIIDRVRSEHPKARHTCFAASWGSESDGMYQRSSDDGEPTGTAGPPILSAIEGEQLSNVVCVVVRYFGGVQLGAAGLIRAYGAATRQVLREAPLQTIEPKGSIIISVVPSLLGNVYDQVAKLGGSVSQHQASVDIDGRCVLTLSCGAHIRPALQRSLLDVTRGEIIFHDDETAS